MAQAEVFALPARPLRGAEEGDAKALDEIERRSSPPQFVFAMWWCCGSIMPGQPQVRVTGCRCTNVPTPHEWPFERIAALWR